MSGMVQREAARKWARVVLGASGRWIALAVLAWEVIDRVGDRKRREREPEPGGDDDPPVTD